MNELLKAKRAGILLHLTSLPSENGPGTMGKTAYEFCDWAAMAGFTVWQILPVGPTHADKSPYLSLSAFAGSPELLDITTLQNQPWLRGSWLAEALDGLEHPTLDEFSKTLQTTYRERAFQKLPDAKEFLQRNENWLRDFAQFMTIRHSQNNKPWWEWPPELAGRSPDAVMKVIANNITHYRQCVIHQYLFEKQWAELKKYAHDKGIMLFGDMPLYVSHDSADVWANRRFFALDENGQATSVAGVPPDYFSATGQIWGNPIFDWSALEQDGFRWWIARIQRQLHLFDILRIDHFRGLEAFWDVPGDAETAIDGAWVEAPGHELLEAVRGTLGDLPLVAEDLGYITPEVDELREAFHLPSMKVYQFGFDGGDDNPHLTENYNSKTVAYTGTHDNDTVRSWFESLHPEAQAFVRNKLGMEETDQDVVDIMITQLLESEATLVITPLQDILKLGPGNRMNTPGTLEGNWSWQAEKDQFTAAAANTMAEKISASKRHTPLQTSKG